MDPPVARKKLPFPSLNTHAYYIAKQLKSQCAAVWYPATESRQSKFCMGFSKNRFYTGS